MLGRIGRRLIPEVVAVQKFYSDLSPTVAIIPAVNYARLGAAAFVSSTQNNFAASFDGMPAYQTRAVPAGSYGPRFFFPCAGGVFPSQPDWH